MKQQQAQVQAVRKSEPRPVRQEYHDPSIRRAKAAARRARKETEQS